MTLIRQRLIKSLAATCLAIVMCPALSFSQVESATPPNDFVALFNGNDLSGWRGSLGDPTKAASMSSEERLAAQASADESMRAHWSVVEGVLRFNGEGHSLSTKKDYKDFELYVDWKIDSAGDSGIYLRGVPQVQIWDTTHEPYFKHGADKGSGGLWNNQKHERHPLVNADHPVGQWNTFFIRMVDQRVTVKLNDQLVVGNVPLENYWDRDQPMPASGPIELQSHGSVLQFRNIYIRELNSPVKSDNDMPVTPTDNVIKLFDGKSLDGLYTWIQGKGHQDPDQIFRVTDGMLHITGNAMGGILTKQVYENYRMVLEFKWGDKTWGKRADSAMDSGLLIHSTGADGGYGGIWMPAIEVQIIEGGAGDFIMVGGPDENGLPVPISMVCEVQVGPNGERIWKRGGGRESFGPDNYHRVDWFGRDPDWQDVRGFRGERDIDSPLGEWTRLEVVCDDGHIQVFVNGTMANEAFGVTPRSGKLQLQSELAEIYFRRWELWPLDMPSDPIPVGLPE